MWEKLVSLWNDGFVMGIGWREKEHGLLTGHAYAVLSLHKVEVEGKTMRLVKIRNPHACGEWTGRFSERSLTAHELRACGMEKADDGVFVMLVDDVAALAKRIHSVQCFDSLPPGRTRMEP